MLDIYCMLQQCMSMTTRTCTVVQVLKDAATRALYDKHLKARTQSRPQIAVSSEVRQGS